MTEQDIAKLICQHTGKRINLSREEYYQFQEFALAVLNFKNEEDKKCFVHKIEP